MWALSYHRSLKWCPLWLCVIPCQVVELILRYILMVFIVQDRCVQRLQEEYPSTPVQPPKVLVEGILVVGVTGLSSLMQNIVPLRVPVLPVLYEAMVRNTPILLLVPMSAIKSAKQKKLDISVPQWVPLKCICKRFCMYLCNFLLVENSIGGTPVRFPNCRHTLTGKCISTMWKKISGTFRRHSSSSCTQFGLSQSSRLVSSSSYTCPSIIGIHLTCIKTKLAFNLLGLVVRMRYYHLPETG